MACCGLIIDDKDTDAGHVRTHAVRNGIRLDKWVGAPVLPRPTGQSRRE